jgi:GNAT superfamily N-acetyltransferase
MLKIIRTNSDHPDFIKLVKELDAYLAVMDGEEHSFYARYNTLDKIKHVVIIYDQEEAVSCGAIKEYDPFTMEIKRMYTAPDGRGKGFATMVLSELENWAKELTYKKTILETGKRQPEAIALYKKNGYTQIPNYGQYAGMDNSVCFIKEL